MPLHDLKSSPPRPRLTATNFCTGNRRRTNGTPTKTEQRCTVMTRGYDENGRDCATGEKTRAGGREERLAGKECAGARVRGRRRVVDVYRSGGGSGGGFSLRAGSLSFTLARSRRPLPTVIIAWRARARIYARTRGKIAVVVSASRPVVGGGVFSLMTAPRAAYMPGTGYACVA